MKVKIEGGVEIGAGLRALGNQVSARRVGRRGLRLGAEPIAATAAALAPDDPETGIVKYLRASIKVAPARSRDKDQLWVRVGIDASEDPAKYVNRTSGTGSYRDPGVAGVSVIMEFGVPGRNVPPKPFMRPAWEANKSVTPQRIADGVRTELSAAAARILRKKAKRR